jgi:4-amino-4-deoxy-L-arabinose transferase-like glycosyltransferase
MLKHTISKLRDRAAEPKFFFRCTLLIMLSAFVLRAVAAFLHPYFLPDSADYQALAQNILAGKPYLVTGMLAKRMPGYPIFMAGIYFVFGMRQWAVLLVQAVCGGLTAGIAGFLGRRISPLTGLAAGLFTVLDPLSIGFSASLLSEIPFTLTLLLSLLLTVRIMEKPEDLLQWVLLGALWAIGVYLRAEAVLCIFPLLAWMVLMNPKSDETVKRLAGPIAVVLLVFLGLMPWWMRNFQNFHEDFFRLTTLEGISLYEAVYPGANGGPKQSEIALPPEMWGLNESQRDLAWKQMALVQIRNDPARMLRLAVIKIARTWSPWLNASGYASAKLNAILTLWYALLYLLALLGMFWRRPNKRFEQPALLGVVVIPILYFTLMHALFIGSVRYRVPIMPEVCILAAIGAAKLLMDGQYGATGRTAPSLEPLKT